jgi:hypothetical protein
MPTAKNSVLGAMIASLVYLCVQDNQFDVTINVNLISVSRVDNIAASYHTNY